MIALSSYMLATFMKALLRDCKVFVFIASCNPIHQETVANQRFRDIVKKLLMVVISHTQHLSYTYGVWLGPYFIFPTWRHKISQINITIFHFFSIILCQRKTFACRKFLNWIYEPHWPTLYTWYNGLSDKRQGMSQFFPSKHHQIL